ncbi:hypothetical protein BGX24_001153 [Mortierella sp. AD032]|nr:hypothetical protein BGX24_001153 [Mortierella sp. AD032]
MKSRKTGSGLLIGPTLLPLFEQLGIMGEFMALGKVTVDCIISKEDKGPVHTVNNSIHKEFTGFYNYVIDRPAFYELLLKQVPTYKILYNKRVLNVTEKDDKIQIQTADNSIYKGDIVVGADGAYSAVRQRIFETLKKEGKLPKADQENMPFSCTCLVGQTRAMDFEGVFPEFMGEMVPFYNTLGNKKPFTTVIGATAHNTITWMVIHHLDRVSSKEAEEQRFRESENSQWGPHSAQALCNETRDFPLPIGTKNMTMGDLYDMTPNEQISKVMLEEKVFKTWYSGRTVLLGDACHKLNPSGAQGAVTAMHDAIALANLIYALPPSPSTSDILSAFSEYQTERLPYALAAYKNSRNMAQFMKPGLAGSFALFMMKYMPKWIWKRTMKDMIKNRPY